MAKEIKLELVKTKTGITASNEDNLTIDMFDDTDKGRQEFVLFMLNEFINKEVDGGRKYN